MDSFLEYREQKNIATAIVFWAEKKIVLYNQLPMRICQ